MIVRNILDTYNIIPTPIENFLSQFSVKKFKILAIFSYHKVDVKYKKAGPPDEFSPFGTFWLISFDWDVVWRWFFILLIAPCLEIMFYANNTSLCYQKHVSGLRKRRDSCRTAILRIMWSKPKNLEKIFKSSFCLKKCYDCKKNKAKMN